MTCEENPHPFPEEKGQHDLIKGERITNAKIRIPNQSSEENEKKEKEEMKRKKRKRRIPNRRSEESKKKKRSKEKQNNSRSIKGINKENRRSSDQINFRRGK